MSTKYEQYVEAKRQRVEAERWNDLPKSKHTYRNASFKMYPAHGKISLMRCGQHSAGSQNYWDSPTALNKAVLEVIANDPAITAAAIAILRKKEKAALLECTEWLDDLNAMITKEKEGEIE